MVFYANPHKLMLAYGHNDQQRRTTMDGGTTTIDNDGLDFDSDVEGVSGYTKKEFLQLLQQRLQRRIPVTTMNHWIVASGLNFKPIYSREDLDLVASLARWLGRGGTTRTFHQLRRQFDATNEK